MHRIISSRVENDYLLIVASGNIASNEDYQLLVKRYCNEIVKSGLDKIIIDESKVQYAPSLLLQIDIVEFYSSGELPEEFKTWKIACVGPVDFMMFYDFWADAAKRKGYDHSAFVSMESAREFIRK